jgi:hypothetical protein
MPIAKIPRTSNLFAQLLSMNPAKGCSRSPQDDHLTSRLECVPLMARHRSPICCSLGPLLLFPNCLLKETSGSSLAYLPSCTHSQFTVRRHTFVMRCVISYSGALPFTRLGPNKPHRTRPQPLTVHQYLGSLTHPRDLARPGPRPSLCIRRTHRRFFSHTMGPVAQAHRWNLPQHQQSAMRMTQSPPIPHWQLLRCALLPTAL